MYLRKLLIFSALFSFYHAIGQVKITGMVHLDDTWNRVIYISEVSSLHEMYQCSEEMIVSSSPINDQGEWELTVPRQDEEKLFRLHISKKDHPPASLIIGGNEENHGFLALGNETFLKYKSKENEYVFSDFSFQDRLNGMMREVQNIYFKWEKIDNRTSEQEEKLAIRKAAISELIKYSDTCSLLLPSMYAIFMSDEGFNKQEVHRKMNMLREKYGDHSYFDDFPSVRRPSMLLEYTLTGILILLGITVIIWIKRFNEKHKMDQLFSSLSQREREVFFLVKSGKTNKEIAFELNVELSTIKSHVNNIFNKLKINSRKDVHQYP